MFWSRDFSSDDDRDPVYLHASNQRNLIRSICENDFVKRHWDLISTFIDDDGICIALLKEIVYLWLTIRGFSLCAAFLEDFKKAPATKTKNKSLRKSIRQAMSV